MPRHNLSNADRSRGGKNVTPARAIANSLRSRKNCDNKCQLYPCPYQHLTYTSELKGACALKKMPIRVQRRIERLFLGGELETIKEYTDSLVSVATQVDSEEVKDKLKSKVIYFDKLGEYIDRLYGDKHRVQLTGSIEGRLDLRELLQDDEVPKNDKNGTKR